MNNFELTQNKLSSDGIKAEFLDGESAMFVGTVKSDYDGSQVDSVTFEASNEDIARDNFKNICAEIRKKWPTVDKISIQHRLGKVPVNEHYLLITINSKELETAALAGPYCLKQINVTASCWRKDIHHKITGKGINCNENQKDEVDKYLIQVNISNEEMNRRINSFIESKREQINMLNIKDFIPSMSIADVIRHNEIHESDTCARVRAEFIKRKGSKSHLKVSKVVNEWGPQTVDFAQVPPPPAAVDPSLPPAIAERFVNLQKFLHLTPVDPDIYSRLKQMEDKIKLLSSVSPEYAHLWNPTTKPSNMDCKFRLDDIENKIRDLKEDKLSLPNNQAMDWK